MPTPKKLSQHFSGLPIKKRKPQLVGALTQTTEDASALLGIVRVSAWIAIDEVPFEHVVDQNGELPRGGGDRLGLADARG